MQSDGPMEPDTALPAGSGGLRRILTLRRRGRRLRVPDARRARPCRRGDREQPAQRHGVARPAGPGGKRLGSAGIADIDAAIEVKKARGGCGRITIRGHAERPGVGRHVRVVEEHLQRGPSLDGAPDVATVAVGRDGRFMNARRAAHAAQDARRERTPRHSGIRTPTTSGRLHRKPAERATPKAPSTPSRSNTPPASSWFGP